MPDGRPLSPNTDFREWKALLKDAGVPSSRLHDARHSSATVLLLLGGRPAGRAALGVRDGWRRGQVRPKLRPRGSHRPLAEVGGLVFVLVSVAEDAGFEPARAVNPTRFPSERHRPLGESSAGEDTRSGHQARNPVSRLVDSAEVPRAAVSRRTPPGPEGSKGTRALPGARGAVFLPIIGHSWSGHRSLVVSRPAAGVVHVDRGGGPVRVER